MLGIDNLLPNIRIKSDFWIAKFPALSPKSPKFPTNKVSFQSNKSLEVHVLTIGIFNLFINFFNIISVLDK